MIEEFFPKLRKSVPVILQAEMSECGIACLTMVANYYGFSARLSDFRRKFQTSIRGSTLSDVLNYASEIGLQSRPVNADIEYLAQSKLPAILHWNLKHFVVLEAFDGRRYTIVDPARGRLKVSKEEIDKNYTGVMVEIFPALDFESLDIKEKFSIFSLLKKWKGVAGFFTNAIIVSFLIQLLSLASPLFIKIVTDYSILTGDENYLLIVGGLFILIALILMLVTVVRDIYLIRFGAHYYFSMACDVVTHLMRLSLTYFQKRDPVNVADRVGAIAPLRDIIAQNTVATIIDGIGSILIFGVMITFSPQLTVIVIVSFAIYSVVRWAAYSKLRVINAENVENWAVWRSHMEETIRNIAPIRIAGAMMRRRHSVAQKLSQAINSGSKRSILTTLSNQVGNVVLGIETVTIIAIGAIFVINQDMTLGTLFAFLAYRQLAASRLVSLVDNVFQLKMIGVHTERLADIALEPGAVVVGDGESTSGSGLHKELGDLKTVVSMENIVFSYDPDGTKILSKCSLVANRGDFVAIYGGSGQGKSTLLKIMLGLLDPSSGSISICGREVSSGVCYVGKPDVSAVLQDDKLMTGSISQNISFFDDAPDISRLVDVAKHAHIYDDIMGMPMGFETSVGEAGSALSGGQGQRILLARALYQDADLLILDEATAHLDTERERAVLQMLRESGRTIIMVTHRPEALTQADYAYELRAGRLRRTQLGPADIAGTQVKQESAIEKTPDRIQSIELEASKNIEASGKYTFLIYGREDCEPCASLKTIMNELVDEFSDSLCCYYSQFPIDAKSRGINKEDYGVQFYPTGKLYDPSGKQIGLLRGIVGNSLEQQYAYVFKWLEKKIGSSLDDLEIISDGSTKASNF